MWGLVLGIRMCENNARAWGGGLNGGLGGVFVPWELHRNSRQVCTTPSRASPSANLTLNNTSRGAPLILARTSRRIVSMYAAFLLICHCQKHGARAWASGHRTPLTHALLYVTPQHSLKDTHVGSTGGVTYLCFCWAQPDSAGGWGP